MNAATFYYAAVVVLAVALILGERRPDVGRVPHPGYTWSAVLLTLIYLGVRG